jgi:hypothetical protein
MGVPTQGSDYASYLRLISASPQLRVLTPISENDFGQLLNLTLIDVLKKHHQGRCPTLKTYAGYETLPLQSYGLAPLRIQIVSKESATRDADATEPFNRDHWTLVKPTSTGDDVYLWVKNHLKACIEGGAICEGSLASEMFRDCGRFDDEFPMVDVVDQLFND